ncbi:MAG: CAAX prenyl protease-related protein [Verrucomicrobiota bacterium]
MDANPQSFRDPALPTRAHVMPLAVFMAFMLVLQLLGGFIEWRHPDAPWWRRDPAQFIYPIQTLAAGALLVRYWRVYAFNWSWKWSLLGALFGSMGIGFWLLPTTLYDVLGCSGKAGGWLDILGVAARRDGFNPAIFENPAAYWGSLGFRFLRAAVVIAVAEEIFWRGFLMRFVCDWEGDYWRQPFGRGTWISYFVVTFLFMISHGSVDWAAAWLYGTLTYLLCIWSKNLGACVIMHGTANSLMGLYIMAYGKYGLW